MLQLFRNLPYLARNMPRQVGLSLVAVFIAVFATAQWGPGSSRFDVHTVSIIFLVGGLSLWLWLLQTVMEGQSVRPYRPRPQDFGERIANTQIVNWFRSTARASNELWWVLFQCLSYMVVLLGALALANWGTLNNHVYVVYGLSFFFYGWRGVYVPARSMVDY